MVLGVSQERHAFAALCAATIAVACGGQSIQVDDDYGSAGDRDSGGTGVGGSMATGGVPLGGTAGGIPTGGASAAAGAGGIDPCPECPPATYGLVIEGDGEPYKLEYNGFFPVQADAEQVLCPEQPVRGTSIGCGAFYFTVCEDAMSGPPCLMVNGARAQYIDQQGGELWTGSVIGVGIASSADPRILSGTIIIDLTNSRSETRELTVNYTLCMSFPSAAICI